MKTSSVPRSVASSGDYSGHLPLCSTCIPVISLWMAIASLRKSPACFSYLYFPPNSDVMRLKSLPVYCIITNSSMTLWCSGKGIHTIKMLSKKNFFLNPKNSHPATLSWSVGTFSKFTLPPTLAIFMPFYCFLITPLGPYVSACSQCNWTPQTQIPMKTEQKRRERQSMLNVSLGLLSDSH